MLKRRMFNSLLIALMSLTLVAVGCGDDNDGTSNNQSQTDAGDNDVDNNGSDNNEYNPCEDREDGRTTYCETEADCVDTTINSDHCGGCDRTCPSAFGTCTDGECICNDEDSTYCPGDGPGEGACPYLDRDRNNCGECGAACGSDQLCWTSECMSRGKRLAAEINIFRDEGSPCSDPGVPPISYNETLEEAAKAHSQDFAETGGDPETTFEAKIEGAGWTGDGQVAPFETQTSLEFPDTFVERWLEENPDFCTQLMDENLVEIGAGAAFAELEDPEGNPMEVWAWSIAFVFEE